jgi:hypothetical protein
MGTLKQGNTGEAAVLSAFVQRDFAVLVPFGEGQPYDLGVHLNGNVLLRVQCKCAWPNKGCLLFNSHATDHGRGSTPYLGLADVFGVYFPPTQAVYLVPVSTFVSHRARLRLQPTRNNQRRGIRFAADFEFDRWTRAELLDLTQKERRPNRVMELVPLEP